MSKTTTDKTKKRGGRKPTHGDDMIIKVVSEENPKRAGKKDKPFRAHKEWDWYKNYDGKTVGAFLAKYGAEKRANINYDVSKGYIRLSKPDVQAQQKAA